MNVTAERPASPPTETHDVWGRFHRIGLDGGRPSMPGDFTRRQIQEAYEGWAAGDAERRDMEKALTSSGGTYVVGSMG